MVADTAAGDKAATRTVPVGPAQHVTGVSFTLTK